MPDPRAVVCESASRKLAQGASGLPGTRALVGLDGFVDEIIAVVDKRHADGRYEPVRTIAAMADKIRAAAGMSSNYQLIVTLSKLGGNGPIMANALACLGLDVTYIGNLGYPDLHPVFREFAGRARVISIAEPGHTDALEFEDGKLMLGKHESLHEVNLSNLLERAGRDELQGLVRGARLIGLVNWTMLPRVGEIWEHLAGAIFPDLEGPRRTLFIDLADPEMRTREDIEGALALLGRFQEHVDVILGLNLKEAGQIAEVAGVPGPSDDIEKLGDLAASLRESLQVGCVVIHPRRAAAAATGTQTAWFAGPFVKQPRISTGAGDHFNAGFCLGRILGLGLEESLCAGVSTSGYYVRSAKSPSLAELAEFAAALPPPEG